MAKPPPLRVLYEDNHLLVVEKPAGLATQGVAEGAPSGSEAETEAELQALQARLREAMQTRLPRSMWRAYVDACIALADGLPQFATTRDQAGDPRRPGG